MRIIDILQNDKKDTKWIVDNFKKGILFVDNSFQRRYVWVERNQIQLIETILLGYAIPEIYLWETETDPDTGDTKYSIIDGQQRIGAIFDFIDGKFKLKKTLLSNKDATYADKTFAELDSSCKKHLWNYKFSIRQVPQNVSKEEIVKMFLRLNSTDKSLNPQELRNAEFNGEFLKAAQEISELDFWEKNKIFSAADIRRMNDIEFISSLLIFLRRGIDSELTQTAINETYDLFNEVYEEKDDDIHITKCVLEQIQRLIEHSRDNIKFISKTTHFYTLFNLTYFVVTVQDKFSENNLQKISEFINGYLCEDCNEKPIVEYREYSQDATKSKTSRMNRLRVLKEYMGF